MEPEAESYQLHTDEAGATIQDATQEEQVPLSPSRRSAAGRSDIFRDESGDDDESYEEREMTLQELLYSSSSFYAIVVPGEWKGNRIPIFAGRDDFFCRVETSVSILLV